MRLNEAELRRTNFKPGRKITLCDGQEWEFPVPTVKGTVCYADIRDGQTVGFPVRVELDDEIDQCVEALLTAENGVEQMKSIFDAAYLLLSRNYDITKKDLVPLIRWRADDAENEAMWNAISELMFGSSGPKPSPVGGEPA